MNILNILYATICLLLILVAFPIVAITGNEILAILIGSSGIISLSLWLAD